MTPQSFVPAVHTLPHSLSERTMHGAYVRGAGRGAPSVPRGATTRTHMAFPSARASVASVKAG